MTMKRNALAAALAAGVLFTATGFLAADAADSTPTSAPATGPAGGHWDHQGHHEGWGEWRMYRELGLSSEQKTAIKGIMTAAKPQMASLHQQARANRLKLLQTNPADSNYSNIVAEVAQSDATLASQRATQSAALEAEIYNSVLTAPQRSQLASLKAQWAAKITAREAAHTE